MLTKYEQYYNKISEFVSVIETEQGYPNKSMAFNHWYLKSMYDMTDQEIAECIVDGKDDYGIDAIICDEESSKLTVFQFKYPNSTDQLNKEIKQADILKTLNGFDILRGKQNISGENIRFEEFKNRLKGIFIEEFEIVFVSFNDGIVNNKNIVEEYQKNFQRESGSTMIIEYIDKKVISNLFEKLTRTTTVKASVPYKFCQQAYSTNDINSYVGFLNGFDLVESIKDQMLTIFDENIRLLEEKSSVNDQIRITASDDERSNMFYFYNNGIVFICDKATNSPNSLKLNLEGASIVNGCQTVNSLYKVYNDGTLKDDVSLLFRVIEISDYDERSQITSYLNTQNSIKGSYFVANHSIIRDLQEDLLKNGYYLERQKNERKYKTTFGEQIDSSFITIKLEDMVQYYSGYWVDELSAVAKRGKGLLFDTNNINEILKEITSEKIIESFEMYNNISRIITKYRKVRRNENNNDFSLYMNYEQKDLLAEIDEFLFMNTADILLLNISRNLKNIWDSQNVEYTNDELIKNSILLARNTIKPHLSQLAPASLTKKNEIFLEARSAVSNWSIIR